MTEADVSLLGVNFEDVPVLGLAEYRALIQGIPAPTDSQIADFAVFVSDAKSWYKHLPPFLPGAFYFFVDPLHTHQGDPRLNVAHNYGDLEGFGRQARGESQ